MILDQVSDVLAELKDLKIYVKYGRDLKKFKAMYKTYRIKLFYEGNVQAWKYMNEGRFEADTIREMVFECKNLDDLLSEHRNVF